MVYGMKLRALVRNMTIEDIKILPLEADWMRDRYSMYLESGIGPAFIMEDETGPLCAFGCAFLWDGVAEAWFNLIAKRKTITIIRTAKKYLDNKMIELNIRRLHAMVKCNSKISKRFVEKLGFRCETPDGMENYNHDGSSAFMYSKVL